MNGNLIVTAVVTLIAGLGGAMIGAAAVWQSQTRGMLLRERAIAAALLQDLARIERELPRLTEGAEATLLIMRTRNPLEKWSDPQSMGDTHPTLHRWIQPLIVQLAARDAETVGRCMHLEVLLASHSRLLTECHSAYSPPENGLGEMKRLEGAATDPYQAANIGAHAAALVETRRLHAHDTTRYADAAACWRAADRELSDQVVSIRSRLGAIVRSKIPEQPWLTSEELSPQRWSGNE